MFVKCFNCNYELLNKKSLSRTKLLCLLIYIISWEINSMHVVRLMANLFTDKCVNFQRLFIATHRWINKLFYYYDKLRSRCLKGHIFSEEVCDFSKCRWTMCKGLKYIIYTSFKEVFNFLCLSLWYFNIKVVYIEENYKIGYIGDLFNLIIR